MLGGVVKLVLGVFSGVDVLVVDPEVLAELLQFAVAAADAGEALLLVGGKDQLQVVLREANTRLELVSTSIPSATG